MLEVRPRAPRRGAGAGPATIPPVRAGRGRRRGCRCAPRSTPSGPGRSGPSPGRPGRCRTTRRSRSAPPAGARRCTAHGGPVADGPGDRTSSHSPRPRARTAPRRGCSRAPDPSGTSSRRASLATDPEASRPSGSASRRSRWQSCSALRARSCRLGYRWPSTSRYRVETGRPSGSHSASLRRNSRSIRASPSPSPRLDRDAFEPRRPGSGLASNRASMRPAWPAASPGPRAAGARSIRDGHPPTRSRPCRWGRERPGRSAGRPPLGRGRPGRGRPSRPVASSGGRDSAGGRVPPCRERRVPPRGCRRVLGLGHPLSSCVLLRRPVPAGRTLSSPPCVLVVRDPAATADLVCLRSGPPAGPRRTPPCTSRRCSVCGSIRFRL